MKFIKKPIIIDAEQWTGSNISDIVNLASDTSQFDVSGKNLIIHTLEGDMIAAPGDFIIRGISGELYPCKENIFRKSYDICGNVD